MKIAFIGLGNIGGAAAINLARAGLSMRAMDLDADKIQPVVKAGAVPAFTPTQAVGKADVVFTSLPGPTQIDAVGREMVPALKPGSIWVDLSTNDLATANGLADFAKPHEVALVDAPVSGGPEGAVDGTLSIFVGGAERDVDYVWPLLEVIGSKVDHLGPHGTGIAAKIAQVSLCYTQTVTLIEALLLGIKGGVDPAKMLDLIQHSAGTSYAAMTYGPEILAGTYDESFPLSHAAKDLRLAMEMAAACGLELPFTTGVAELYAQAEAEYGSDAAHGLAAQLIERRNGMIIHEQELPQ